MAQPTLLLKGSFDSFSIDDVLDVVGMSRQTMKVVLDDDGRGGEFLVKAGRVIHAEAPPDRGRRAFVNIYREPGQSFAVWQHVEAIGEPIGMLADLIEEAKVLEQEPTAPSRTPMLSGSFADHRLDEVLDVLNMTRQLVEFKTRREDDTSVIMLLKSGQVLACEDLRNSTNGLAAFRSLFKDPGQTFEVVRLDSRSEGELPPRIGALAALVQEARKSEEQDGKKRPGVLFQGAFKNFPLSDVLEALSVTRLTVEMVFHDSDGTRGTFVLKAGQVLAAQALRTGASHREAFHELMAEPGESFIVVRRPGTPAGEPIGRLRDLLGESRSKTRSKQATPPPSSAAPRVAKLRPASSPVPAPSRRTSSKPIPVASAPRARTPTQKSARGPAIPPPPLPTSAKARSTSKPSSAPAAPRAKQPVATIPRKAAPPAGIEIVLDGTFETFSIEDVLEVLGLSRQYVALGTLRNGAPLARVVVKSGRLLMVSHGAVKEPAKALQMLLDDPGTEFRVRRLPRYADSDLGSFAELVEEAKRNKETSTVIHLPPPKPAPAAQTPPDISDIDIDDLFAEIEDPPKLEVSKPKRGAKAPYRPPERKKKPKVEAKTPEVKAPEAKAPEVKAPEAKAPSKPSVKAPSKSSMTSPSRPEAKAPSKPVSAPAAEAPPPSVVEVEPEIEVDAPVAKSADAKPSASPERSEPAPEATTAMPASAPSAAPIAAAAVASNESIAKSLSVIEERLRTGGADGAVGSDEAVKALRKIDEHVEALTDSVKELAKQLDQMRDKMIAETKSTRTTVVFLQFVVVLGIAAVLAMFFLAK